MEETRAHGEPSVVTVETFDLPELDSGVVAGELVRWLVDPGEEVTTGQPVAEVETGKAVVEVPAPAAGTVAERHAEAGGTVMVGGPFVSLVVADE